MFLGRSAKPRTKLQILNKFIAVFKSDRFGHSPPTPPPSPPPPPPPPLPSPSNVEKG